MTICDGYVFSSDMAFLLTMPHVREIFRIFKYWGSLATLFVDIFIGQRHSIQLYPKILCNVQEQKIRPLEHVSYTKIARERFN